MIRATEKLISYSPQLVDIKKDDGFSAFHLAALNGHKDVIKILVQSKADKEILNNRRQTPLLLAVAQLHAPIIELLVEKSIRLVLLEYNIINIFILSLLFKRSECKCIRRRRRHMSAFSAQWQANQFGFGW